MFPAMESLLTQGMRESSAFENSLQQLQSLWSGAKK